jgi:hypothetical protein
VESPRQEPIGRTSSRRTLWRGGRASGLAVKLIDAAVRDRARRLAQVLVNELLETIRLGVTALEMNLAFGPDLRANSRSSYSNGAKSPHSTDISSRATCRMQRSRRAHRRVLLISPDAIRKILGTCLAVD